MDKKKLLIKAREGNAKAQLTVALNYIWGVNGFPVSERSARIWYNKSALNGNAEAMFNLSTMLLRGEGGKTDIDSGMAWLKKAALSRQKHFYKETASRLLCEIYRHGYYSIQADLDEAGRWERLIIKIASETSDG